VSLRPGRSVPDVIRSLAERPREEPFVHQLFPSSLRRFARVFNPAHDRDDVSVRWSHLADDGVVHPETSWLDISYDRDVILGPQDRGIDVDVATALGEVLREFTTTSEQIYFMSWEGYTGIAPRLAMSSTVTLRGLEMFVFEGRIEDCAEPIHQWDDDITSQWWVPGDGAWMVGNDVYGASVYVAGTDEAIAAVVASDRLEAIPVPGSTRVISEELD
jgi:hypothetical protein